MTEWFERYRELTHTAADRIMELLDVSMVGASGDRGVYFRTRNTNDISVELYPNYHFDEGECRECDYKTFPLLLIIGSTDLQWLEEVKKLLADTPDMDVTHFRRTTSDPDKGERRRTLFELPPTTPDVGAAENKTAS